MMKFVKKLFFIQITGKLIWIIFSSACCPLFYIYYFVYEKCKVVQFIKIVLVTIIIVNVHGILNVIKLNLKYFLTEPRKQIII